MEGEFWGYGLVAVSIAVTFSSVELLTKYQSRSLREIFLSPYYLGFALLNAFFCFLVYWGLPALGNLAIKSDLLTTLKGPLVRAITAGLGYLVIARASILDIRVRGETLGVGFDGIYNAIAQYLLRHHNQGLRRQLRTDFSEIYRELPTDAPVFFLGAARLLPVQAEGDEKQRMEDELRLSLTGKPAADRLCFSLYLLIRNYTANVTDAKDLILDQKKELEKNSSQAGLLKRELDWIYSPS